MTRQAGHTIIELMIVGSILTVFAVTLLSFTCQQRAADQHHAAYTHDLLGARHALDRIVADLRHATLVEPTPEGVSIHTNNGNIQYTLKSGRLDRCLGKSHRRIAIGIADLGCWQHGAIAHVRIVLRNRIHVAGGKHQPAIETSVALHLAETTPRKG